MEDPTTDVLLLGLQSSGKTYLIKQLKSLSKGEDVSKLFQDCIPTIGVNLDQVQLSSAKKKPVHLKIREVGGSLILTWPRYYEDCRMVVFVVDMTNYGQISGACLEILNLVTHFLHKEKGFLILLNKSDAPATVSPAAFKRLLRWNDLVKQNYGTIRLHILECSGYSGHNLNLITDWLLNQLEVG